jgi:hypothetical protein
VRAGDSAGESGRREKIQNLALGRRKFARPSRLSTPRVSPRAYETRPAARGSHRLVFRYDRANAQTPRSANSIVERSSALRHARGRLSHRAPHANLLAVSPLPGRIRCDCERSGVAICSDSRLAASVLCVSFSGEVNAVRAGSDCASRHRVEGPSTAGVEGAVFCDFRCPPAPKNSLPPHAGGSAALAKNRRPRRARQRRQDC